MKILKIHDGHDSGASLSDKGVVIAAVNEERLSRIKLFSGFPKKSIRFVLGSHKHYKPDKVIITSKFTPAFFLRIAEGNYRAIRKNMSSFDDTIGFYTTYQTILRYSFPLRWIDKFLSFIVIYIKIIMTIGLIAPWKICFNDHHDSHIKSAFESSKMKKALVISCDHLGDGVSVKVDICEKGKQQNVFIQGPSGSLGLLYARITDLLGFTPGKDEGKVMGLAAYGKPKDVTLVKFDKKFILSDISYKQLVKTFKGSNAQDVAATVQKNLENAVVDFVRYLIVKHKIKDVAVTGGVFANVKLNKKINETTDRLWVFPHMGDGGLVGGKFKSIFLGPKYNSEKYLKKHKIKYIKMKYPGSLVSKLLVDQKIIGIYAGRMEFGPRALGNRSVICPPDLPELYETLNKKLKRDDFMPFAPVVLEEKFNLCFRGKKSRSAKFMTIAYDCKKYMDVNSPAAIHIDNTARPQLLKEKDNPLMYDILSHYYKYKSIPCLINTSFNMHEEPIVCTPEDALRAFKAAKLDYLVMEDCLIDYNDLPPDISKSRKG